MPPSRPAQPSPRAPPPAGARGGADAGALGPAGGADAAAAAGATGPAWEPPIVVLVETQHPGNVGAAARAAANFGVAPGGLRFVRPQCDVRGKEALDRAVHAKPLLEAAPIVAELQQALDGASLAVGTTARSSEAPNRFQRKPLDLRDWSESLAGLAGRIAYVFGSEQHGLATADVERLDQLVTIPTADYASMNVSHALAVVCYEHARAAAARITPPRVLDPGAVAALGQAWDDLVDATENRDWRKQSARGVFRKVVARSAPDTYEIHNVMGIVTNALKRFGHPRYATEVSERVLRERGLRVRDEAASLGPAEDSGEARKP